jgi:hypothetical protein
MTRVFFALVVTAAGFLAGSLWWARSGLETPAPAEALAAAPMDAALPAGSTLPAEPAPAPAGSALALAEPAPDAEPVEERLAARAPFGEAPLDAAGPGATPLGAADLDAADDPAQAEPGLAPSDQDAWAQLIRRMLALQRRTGA